MFRNHSFCAGALAALIIALFVSAQAGAAAMKVWLDTFEDGNTTNWTINQSGASITVDGTMANTGLKSLKVAANSTTHPNGNGATAQGKSVPLDFTQDYTVQFALRYASFHWDRIVLFGHIRLLIDQAGLPLLYDPVGNNSFPGNRVSLIAFNSYLLPNAWGWITVHCRPSLRQYTVFINGTLVGTVSYQASVVPTSRFFFEENYSSSNYMNAWYDDFSVWGMQDPTRIAFIRPGLVSDPENDAGWAQPPAVPYHAQFNVPDIIQALAEPCSPPRANQRNGRCVVASLAMVFDRFENLPPANAPPNPQEEIAAAANTSDRLNCQNGQPGNWFGTRTDDGRRAAHFSTATAAATAVRGGCPPAGCPAGQANSGYTWRSLGHAAREGRWSDVAPEDTVDVNAQVFPWKLESLLASGYPLIVCYGPPDPADCAQFFNDESEGLKDPNACGPENTVVGHCIVLIGYDNTGLYPGNTSLVPAFLVHDPAWARYQWIPAPYFWNTIWTEKRFIFAAPWETMFLSPPAWTFSCKFDGTVLATYPGPGPLAGSFPVSAQAKLSAMTFVGLQGGEVATHNMPGIANMGDWGFSTFKLVGSARPACPTFCIWFGGLTFEASGTLNPAASSTSYAQYADRLGGSGQLTKSMGSGCGKLVDAGYRNWPYPGRWWNSVPGGSDLRLLTTGGPMAGLTARVANQGTDPIPGGTVCRFYYGEPTLAGRLSGGGIYIGEATVPTLSSGDTTTVGPIPWTRPPVNGFGEPHFVVYSQLVASGDPSASPWPQDENNVAALAEFDLTATQESMAPATLYDPVTMTFLVENPDAMARDVVLAVEKEPGAAAWTVELFDAGDQPIPTGQPIPMGPSSSKAARVVITPVEGDTVASMHVESTLYETGGGALVRLAGGVTVTVHLPAPVSGVDAGDGLPPLLVLRQNQPNPFQRATTIEYAIGAPGRVGVTVFDVAGRLVKTLISEKQPAGRYEVAWTGKDDSDNPVARGIYFYRLEVDGRTRLTRKMLMVGR